LSARHLEARTQPVMVGLVGRHPPPIVNVDRFGDDVLAPAVDAIAVREPAGKIRIASG
jgi:hypothetical protein